MRVYGVICILAAWLSLNTTAHAKTVDDYVTFHKGESKKYIVIMMPGTQQQDISFFSNYCHGKEEINGREVFRIEEKRNTGKKKTTFKYFFIDERGYFRFGHFYKGTRTIYETPACIIKEPIEVGRAWKNTLQSYKNDVEGWKEVREIISKDDAVETPFGVLENCIKIHSQKTKGDVTASSEIWYCPDVGHVKTIINVPAEKLTIEQTLQKIISP
jgi:hypothetical protein